MDSDTTDAKPTEWRRSVVCHRFHFAVRDSLVYCAGVIAYRGAIYAMGGFNGTARLNTGERYSPAMNAWRPIADMFHPRSNFAIEVRPLSVWLMMLRDSLVDHR